MLRLLPLLALLLLVLPTSAQPHVVESPDGSLVLTFELDDEGAPTYQMMRKDRPLIRSSRLGFVLRNAPPLLRGFEIEEVRRSARDETWTQPWGEEKTIRDHHNELAVDLVETNERGRRMTVRFRLFDGGFGLRYELPEQSGLDSVEILDERTEFALTGDPTTWSIDAYQPNRYEYLYQERPLSAIDTVHTPITMRTDEGLYLSFHEAALTDYSSMTLARTGARVLEADLVPWSDGVKVRGPLPMKTPWRTVQVGETAGELVTDYLILNLNEPSQIEDTSWLDPGKYLGIWWSMHLGIHSWGSGEKHGATTERAKRYIDFAAEHGFDGVLVEGWNTGWDGNWMENGKLFDFTTPYPDFDLQEVARYAREKGTRLIGHHETGAGVENYEAQMDTAFALYEDLGVRTVKTGYVGHGRTIERTGADGETHNEWHHGQHMVEHYRKATETAARHHVQLDVHEPIKPTGIRRTWPNLMTREGARGMEYNAWSEGNGPEHTTILPFTRLLGGPFDLTPGIVDLTFEEVRADTRVPSTLAKQLALYVVIYSPLHMAADLPENYEANLEAFRFIKEVPTDWETTLVPHAEIGDYVTIVRRERDGDDWYLGSVTDEKARTLELQLDFLEPDAEYVAEIYMDAESADWETSPHAFERTERSVTAEDTIELKLAPGGGQAIRFRKL